MILEKNTDKLKRNKNALNRKCEYGNLPRIPFNSIKAAETHIQGLTQKEGIDV